jgi:AraC-like DNA-binding protein
MTFPGEQSGNPARPEHLVIGLVHGPAERARIASTLRARAMEVMFVDRNAELIDAVTQARAPVAAIIVEVRDADGLPVHEIVGDLHAGGTGTPLVAYCRAGAEHSTDIRALVLAGAHQLLFHGIDDAGIALRHILDAAQQAAVGERAREELMRVVPPKLSAFVSHVTRYPETEKVTEVADALGYNRRTLVNHCAEAEFLPPHELLCWCRLAVAGELMASSGRTIEAIANQLEFASDTSLRNKPKRYTGQKASEVRERGGACCVVTALRAALPRGVTSQRSAG